MIKKAFLIFIVNIFTILPLTGCWDRKELNEIGIVLAMGIDKDESGKFTLTSQMIRPISSHKGQSNRETSVTMVTAQGDSLLEATRNTAKKSDRISFFPHVRIVVVGERVAREGIYDVIDLVSRTPQLRANVWLMIAKDKKASDVLQIRSGIENIQASYLEGIIKGKKINTEITAVQALGIIKKIEGEGINPVTGAFRIITEEKPQVEGKSSHVKESIILSEAAVFNKDKLVGYLNEVETRGFNIIAGKTKSSAVRVPSNNDESKYTSIVIKKVKSHIKPYVINGKISFDINVKVIGDIWEVPDNTNILNQEEIYKINDKFRKVIENSINKCAYKTQKELKTDILGFGSTLNSRYPKEWKKVKDQWDKIFVTMPYTVSVETNIKNTGLILKPLNIPEK